MARARSRAQRLVEALAPEPRILRDLRHAARLRHVAEGGEEDIGVRVFGRGREVFGDDLVIVEIIGGLIQAESMNGSATNVTTTRRALLLSRDT